MIEAARQSGVCTSFMVWGIGDGGADSWLAQPGAPLPMATPYDSNLKPKPSFTALLDGLSDQGPLQRPLSRRRLLQGAGALAAAMMLGEACGSSTSPRPLASAAARLSATAPATTPARHPGLP